MLAIEIPGLNRLAPIVRSAIAGWAIVFLAGCAASRPEPFHAAIAQRAQLVAQNPGGRIRFDGIFARDARGNVALDLYKAGIQPVAVLRLSTDGRAIFYLHAEGRTWRGMRSEAPASVAPLLEILAIYSRENELEDGEKEIRTPAGQVAIEVRQGRLQSVAVAGEGRYAALAVFSRAR